jgi:hypothetical protein
MPWRADGGCQFQNQPADIQRVHLLVFPRPHQGLPHDLADLFIHVNGSEPPGDQVLALGNRDQFFLLQRQQAEADHLQPRPAGIPLVPLRQLTLELFVYRCHRVPVMR